MMVIFIKQHGLKGQPAPHGRICQGCRRPLNSPPPPRPPSVYVDVCCAYSDVEPRDLHLPAPRDLQLLEHDAVELGLWMY